MQATKTKTKRSPRPAKMAWLTPHLMVQDVTKAMNFYEESFGFEKGMTMPDKDGAILHGEMKYEGSVVIMLGREGAWGSQCKSPAASNITCPVNLYVYCRDVDEIYHRAKQAGAGITTEPADMFWGDRIVEIVDIDGYRWTFATNVADFDPSKAPK